MFNNMGSGRIRPALHPITKCIFAVPVALLTLLLSVVPIEKKHFCDSDRDANPSWRQLTKTQCDSLTTLLSLVILDQVFQRLLRLIYAKIYA